MNRKRFILILAGLFIFIALPIQTLANSIARVENSQQDGNITITGKVIDDYGEGIIGASVVVDGTTVGTVTDTDGNFTLTSVPPTATITISYIGFKSQTFKATDSNLSNVVLKEDSNELEGVVVVGYGTQKKVNLSGAVGTITAEDLENRPVVSAANALQGADPSMNITLNTGSPSSGYAINIRGVVSINGGSPLILADGIETDLNQINPNDIESVSVLKDASAAAIYGAKASSGVVLITTKKGRDTEGKAKITYSGRYGVSQNTTSTDFITTGYDHATLVNSFYSVEKGTNMFKLSDDELQMLLDRRNDKTENSERPWTIVDSNGNYKYYGNFDWYDYFYRKSRPQTEHNVSFSGGTKKFDYFISGRFLSQDGIFNIYHDNYKNYSFRAKIGAQLTSWLKYTANINYNNNTYKYAGYENEQQTIHSLQSNVNSMFVPFNPDGTIVQYTNQMTANSPLGAGHAGFLSANQARNKRGTQQYTITNQFDANVTKDLVITASYAYKYNNNQNTYRSMPFTYSRKQGETKTFTSGTIYDYYKEKHLNCYDHNFNLYGTYTKTLNQKHNFKVLLGTQFEDYRSTDLVVKQTDLLSEDLSSFSVATGEPVITQAITTWRTLGYFGRINYDYEGKYMAEFSARADGSSRFAANDRWGFFPSASFAWRLSEEKFFEPLRSWWDNAKIRLSYGSLGNQQVSTYSYIDQIYANKTMTYTFDNSTNANYAVVSDPISSNLTWETVSTYNIGIDGNMLNSRLGFSFDYFIRYTKDMLTESLTLPSVFGANTPKENCADLRTNGWEFTISWKDQFTLSDKPFKYNLSFSIGDYKSTITKFNNPDKLLSDYYEGMTLGEIWGYRVAGLFESDEAAAEWSSKIKSDAAVNGRIYKSKNDNYLRAGDVEFIDLNGDGSITEGAGTVDDPGDREIIGNSTPRFTYSFRMGANWNGFDVSAFFQGVGKQDWYPTTYAYDFWGPYSFPSLSFIHKDFVDNVWTEDNTGAYFPRQRGYLSYSSGALGVINDRYLQNVAYLRLKNLTIGYTVPIPKKIINELRVYVTGENLFYWSPLKKYCKTIDPELASSSSTYNSGSGVGYTYSKSFSIGVNIIF